MTPAFAERNSRGRWGTTMKRYVAILAVLLCAAGRGSGAEEPRVVELWPGKAPEEPGTIGEEKKFPSKPNKERSETDHLLGLMTDPSVDNPLVDPSGCAIAAETVAEDVPAAKPCPFTSCQSAFEMIVRFVARNRSSVCSLRLAPYDRCGEAEREVAARVPSKPAIHDCKDQRGHRHAAC